MRAGIVAVGSYIPERILTNKDLEKMVDTTDEWIVSRTGIKERRIASEDEVTSDLGAYAARNACKMGGISLDDIDLILVSTITPDMGFPSTACFVQQKLGIKNIPCMDISAACAGFVYSLDLAVKYVNSGDYKTVLVIGAEIISRITDWQDRNTCILFGDGAGAVLVRDVPDGRGVIKTVLGADGTYVEYLNMPGGGTRHPASHRTVDERLHFLKMKGNDIFKLAVKSMVNALTDVLEKAGVCPGDVDLFIPHQANRRIITALASKCKIPLDRVYMNLEMRGNISAASAIVALDDAYKEGRIKEGMLIAFVAFGGGLTWGASLVRW